MDARIQSLKRFLMSLLKDLKVKKTVMKVLERECNIILGEKIKKS